MLMCRQDMSQCPELALLSWRQPALGSHSPDVTEQHGAPLRWGEATTGPHARAWKPNSQKHSSGAQSLSQWHTRCAGAQAPPSDASSSSGERRCHHRPQQHDAQPTKSPPSPSSLPHAAPKGHHAGAATSPNMRATLRSPPGSLNHWRDPHTRTLGVHEAQTLWWSPMSVAGPPKHFRAEIEAAGSGAPDAIDNTCAQLGSSGQRRQHDLR